MSVARTLPLSRGQIAIVDAADFDRVARFTWFASPTSHDPNKFYACRTEQRNGVATTIYLHRFIMDAPAGSFVDHEDRDGLNCCRLNMRIATRSQNNANRRSTSRQPYRGIEPHPKNPSKWRARLELAGRVYRIGGLDTPEDAARAYDQLASEHFGEFAFRNFPLATGAGQ